MARTPVENKTPSTSRSGYSARGDKLKPLPPPATLPDYKDVKGLQRYLDDRGKIIHAARSGLSARQQRRIAREIKRARHLALLPFTQTLH